jgi:hypothetical protein
MRSTASRVNQTSLVTLLARSIGMLGSKPAAAIARLARMSASAVVTVCSSARERVG